MDPVTLVLGTALCVLVVFYWIRLANLSAHARQLESELRSLRSQLEIKERTLAQQREAVLNIQKETAGLAKLLQLLPEMAKQLSAIHSTRELEEGIVTLTQNLLEAQQVSLFSVQNDTLVLKAHQGLSPAQVESLRQIKVGEGLIGWTAQKRVIMTAEDFQKESNLVKASLHQDRFKEIPSDVCAPLVHWDRFYGVINAGGVGAKKEDLRRLIGLISHLGVIALENVLLLHEIQRQADIDGLTNLYNATYFHKYLDREIQKAQRYDRPLTVVIFDIDQFAAYNQLLGRHEGDQVIRIVSGLIKDSLRTVDIPCRYGGEEIAVALPETDREKGIFVAERTRQSVESHPFSLKRVTISGGLAVYPSDAKDAKELLKKAESALEAAKQSGRNRITAFTPLP